MDENTYGHGDVKDYVEPRRPRGPSDEEIRKTTRALIWKRVAIGSLVLFALVVISGMVYTVYVIRQQQLANTPITESTNTAALQAKQAAEDAKRSADRIEDCTTPGRACYERGQKQLAGAVGSVNKLALIATSCAVQIEKLGQVSTEAVTYQLISRCVQRLVADENTQPPSITPGAGTSP